MKEIQVGKVMLTFKGEYDSTKTYTRLDAVTYQGSSYVCLADTSTAPPSDSWQLLAKKGTDGLPGKDGQPGKDGNQGKQGNPGANGVSPHVDKATGHWFVGSSDTGVSAQGPKGDKGDTGPAPDTKTFATKSDLTDYYPKKVFKTGSVDFNGLTNAGAYTVDTGSQNDPLGNGTSWYYVFVNDGADSNVAQLALPQAYDRWFYRRLKDGQWSAWQKLANSFDLDSYYTKSQTNSAITNAVDKIRIGGRNLILNSKKETSGKSYGFAQYNFAEDLQPGETYTLSAYGRVDQTALNHKQVIAVYVYSPDWSFSTYLKIPASLTNKYGQLTFTVPADKHPVKHVTIFLMHPDGATDSSKDNLSGTAFVSHLKLEKGNKATDWTPAPEDFDTKLSTKADKSQLPDMSKYAQTSDIPSLSGYAKLSDIPSVSGFLKQADLAGYVKTGDLANYAKLSDLPAPVDTSSFATNTALSSVRTTAQSASNAASSAQSTARAAQNTANNAESRAESAYSLASTASSDAKAATQVPVITSGTLADLANKQGVYHYEIDFLPTDMPDTKSRGYCDVTVSEHYAREVYTAASDGGTQYIRTRDWGSSTWSDWRQVTLWN